MAFWLSITDGGSAGRLAERLLVSAVMLAVGAEAVQVGLAHSVEGITTPILRSEAPKDTGALAAGLRAHVTTVGALGQTVVSFESDVPYEEFVREGSGEYHVPDAHSSWDTYGFQHFMVDGEDIYTMQVHHLGQHPNDYVGRALERARPALDAALAMAGESLMASFTADWNGPL